jgi:hypothetical protein
MLETALSAQWIDTPSGPRTVETAGGCRHRKEGFTMTGTGPRRALAPEAARNRPPPEVDRPVSPGSDGAPDDFEGTWDELEHVVGEAEAAMREAVALMSALSRFGGLRVF